MAQPTAARSIPLQDRPDPNLGVLLREPYLAFSAEVLLRLHAAGYTDLRPAHLVVFQHIDPDGSRITDLAAKAQMTKPSMGYLVSHLERCDYLERVPDPDDGRARIVRLTARGWREVDDALTIIAGMERELADAIGSRQLSTLRRLLETLQDATRSWTDA